MCLSTGLADRVLVQCHAELLAEYPSIAAASANRDDTELRHYHNRAHHRRLRLELAIYRRERVEFVLEQSRAQIALASTRPAGDVEAHNVELTPAELDEITALPNVPAPSPPRPTGPLDLSSLDGVQRAALLARTLALGPDQDDTLSYGQLVVAMSDNDFAPGASCTFAAERPTAAGGCPVGGDCSHALPIYNESRSRFNYAQRNKDLVTLKKHISEHGREVAGTTLGLDAAAMKRMVRCRECGSWFVPRFARPRDSR